MAMSGYEYDKRNMMFGHSSAVHDSEVIESMKLFSPNTYDLLQQDSNEYINVFTNWLKNSTNNKLIGIEDFPYAVYSNGTTEGFEKFYWNNQNRRFRCFKGEYLYHKLAWRDWNWAFIEDDDLRPGDAVVISLPFADTGCKHKNHDYVLNVCNAMNIPVLIDACYFGISKDIEYDFTHKCITDITFSLSKVFPVAHARIGLRLTRVDTDDLLFVYHKHSYNNRLGAELGKFLMKNFTSDFIYNKYRNKQKSFCDILKVAPSDTVIFGLGDKTWSQYNRGTETNRLGLQNFLHKSVEEFKTIYET